MYLQKRGEIYYIFYHNEHDQKTCISTRCKKKSDALRFLTTFQQKLEEQRSQTYLPITIGEFEQKYMNYIRQRLTDKTCDTYRITFKYLKEFFGADLQLTDLSFLTLQDYFSYRLEHGSLFQCRKDLINLNSMFEFSITRNYLESNPARKIPKFRVPQKLPLYFRIEDFEKWLQACNKPDIKNLATIAYNTGMRQMELIELRWNQVNFKERVIYLDNQSHVTKNKLIRTVPLNLQSMQVLSELQINRIDEMVFRFDTTAMDTQQYVSHAFKRIVKKSGINPKLNFHHLRHGFASRLVQSGVPLMTVSKLLGHTTVKTSEIYAHLQPQNLMNAVSLLD